MIPVICIVGPTAVGKTSLSIALAHQLQCEIINGDAFQVYQGLDIGTAKIKPHEMEGIPHHLFSHIRPDEDYDVMRYQHEVRQAIAEVHARHHLPILIGGTGLYLRAALYDYQFASDTHTIDQLLSSYELLTSDELFSRLAEKDPIEALKLHANNRRRVARALALVEATGKPAHMRHQATPLAYYDITWIGLTMDRKRLHERQNERVDFMIKEGLIDEAKAVFGSSFGRLSTSAQAIGYKELFPYLRGEQSLEEAIQQIKIHTHQFTKRQMTWFNHQVPVHWISVEQPFDDIVQDALHYIQQRRAL